MPLPTCGLKLLAHAALSYYCTRPDAIGSYGLKLLDKVLGHKATTFFFLSYKLPPPPFFFSGRAQCLCPTCGHKATTCGVLGWSSLSSSSPPPRYAGVSDRRGLKLLVHEACLKLLVYEALSY
jgi:hypothetical protein